MLVHPTALLFSSEVQVSAMVREYSTIRRSTVGRKVRIYERVSIKRSHIEHHVSINTGTYVENATIGAHVQIGPNCTIVGVWHQITEKGGEEADVFNRIAVGAHVLIGAGVVVTPGVIIGTRSVIGAGSLVTKTIPEAHIYYGRPGISTCIPLSEYILCKTNTE